MDHVAIMNKSWNLIPKILSGEKHIESRWYKAKYPPWNRIASGDAVYFKDAGCPVTARAVVEKVEQHESFSEETLKKILDEHAGKGHISFTSSYEQVFAWAKQRKYCILIFLKNPKQVAPFAVDKTGFGNACAWMCVGNIEKVRKK